MKNNTTTTLYLQNPVTRSDKTYIVETKGLDVFYSFGKRNGALTTMFQTCDDAAEAKALHAAAVAEKKAEGYTTKAPKADAKAKTVDAKNKKAPVVEIDNAWRGPAAVKAWIKIRRIRAIAEKTGKTYQQVLQAENKAAKDKKAAGKKAVANKAVAKKAAKKVA